MLAMFSFLSIDVFSKENRKEFKPFKVNKKVINGLTFTSVAKLTTKKQREKELMELLGGGFGEVNDYASILLERSAA